MVREWRAFALLVFSRLRVSGAEELKMWFGYTKEDRRCLQDDVLTHFIGGGGSADLLSQASIVALLQVARRPSAADVAGEDRPPGLGLGSCEADGGVSLDAQMAGFMGNVQSVVQVHNRAELDAVESDETLLSVWYDPSVVSPGDALVYRNVHGLGRPVNASACIEVGPPKRGDISVRYDGSTRTCPTAVAEQWPQYASSWSSLITTWLPSDGSPPFAIFGANLPAQYSEGKNLMLQRAMRDTEAELGVSQDRVFIIGDLNARLLDSAYSVCTNRSCAEAAGDVNRTMDLSQVGDIEPCAELRGHSSHAQCTQALRERDDCRRDCVAHIACDAEAMDEAVRHWSELDTKRGAGGHDLLARHFAFPPEVSLDGVPELGWSSLDGAAGLPRSALSAGAPRLPTYKRLRDEEVPDCAPGAPFLGPCQANPCRAAPATRHAWGDARCAARLRECFGPSAGTTVDTCPEDDPVCAGRVVVSPRLGWLDAFGYSRGFRENVTVLLYQDRLDMTFGDHSCFVAGAALRLEGAQAEVEGTIEDSIACRSDWCNFLIFALAWPLLLCKL